MPRRAVRLGRSCQSTKCTLKLMYTKYTHIHRRQISNSPRVLLNRKRSQFTITY